MIGTILERFEANFTKIDGCWNWTAFKGWKGYGQIKVDGRKQLAHRVAYQLYVGEIPTGLCVCHICDNPSCVNPAHLFLGTNADNARDRENKARGTPGEKNGRAKLTEADVIIIRLRRALGDRGIDLADEYGVSNAAISAIVHRVTWVHV